MIMQEESIVSSSRNVFFFPTILESCQDVVNAKRTFFPLFLLFPFLQSCLFPPGGGGRVIGNYRPLLCKGNNLILADLNLKLYAYYIFFLSIF